MNEDDADADEEVEEDEEEWGDIDEDELICIISKQTVWLLQRSVSKGSGWMMGLRTRCGYIPL